MMLIAYDGAVRREELVTLEINDFDFAHREDLDLSRTCEKRTRTDWWLQHCDQPFP